MCLAVPGKVVEILGEGELRMGQVDFGGVRREACLAYVPEAQLGDYVLVHVGFAIARVDEQQAQETLRALEEIGALAELEAPDAGGGATGDSGAPDAPRSARPGGVHDA
jgi:hydrogenase expression/formation protein HypC